MHFLCALSSVVFIPYQGPPSTLQPGPHFQRQAVRSSNRNKGRIHAWNRPTLKAQSGIDQSGQGLCPSTPHACSGVVKPRKLSVAIKNSGHVFVLFLSSCYSPWRPQTKGDKGRKPVMYLHLLSTGEHSTVLTRDIKFWIWLIWFKTVEKHPDWLVTKHLAPLNPELVQETRPMQARVL